MIKKYGIATGHNVLLSWRKLARKKGFVEVGLLIEKIAMGIRNQYNIATSLNLEKDFTVHFETDGQQSELRLLVSHAGVDYELMSVSIKRRDAASKSGIVIPDYAAVNQHHEEDLLKRVNSVAELVVGHHRTRLSMLYTGPFIALRGALIGITDDSDNVVVFTDEEFNQLHGIMIIETGKVEVTLRMDVEPMDAYLIAVDADDVPPSAVEPVAATEEK